MGIEQKMEFDFSITEKLEVAHKFNIVASQENLAKLNKNEAGEWELGGISVETLLDLYSDNDNSEQYSSK